MKINYATYKFNKDLDPNFGDDYAAYVYRTTITFGGNDVKKFPKKIYIGAHKGSILDDYDFSTENEEFLTDLNNPINKVFFEIVKKGTEWDMFDLENQMLEKVDAKNPNNEYYNNTNGGSRYTSLSAAQEARIDDFIHKFKSGKFKQYEEMISVDDIDEYERIQIRTEDQVLSDKEYTDNIAAQIDAVFGQTDFLPPCLAFEGWNGKTRLWVDGNQREEGVNKSKRGKTVKTVVIPKKIWKVFTKGLPEGEISSSIFDIAFILNPVHNGPLNMKPKEVAKRIFERSKSREQIKSDFNKRFLRKQNRVGSPADKILSMAVELWDNQEEADKHGKGNIFHDPTSVRGKEIIAKAKEELQKKYPDDIVISASSTVFGVAHMEGQVQQPLHDDQKKRYPTKLVKLPKGKEKRIIPLIFIPNQTARNEWFGGKMLANYQSCELYLEGTGFILAPPEEVSLIAPKVKGGISG